MLCLLETINYQLPLLFLFKKHLSSHDYKMGEEGRVSIKARATERKSIWSPTQLQLTMASHAKLSSVLMSTLLVFSVLTPLEMGGASPVPTHNNKNLRDFLKTFGLAGLQKALHKGSSALFQQRHDRPPIPMAKNQHHKQSHVPLPPPPPPPPLASTTVKEDKLSLSKELEELLKAKLEQWNPRTPQHPPTVYGRDKLDRNQSRPTFPYLKGRSRGYGKQRTPEMVTTESPTPPLTTEISTTTEEIVPTTQVATTTVIIEETTTAKGIEATPASTTTASPLDAMGFVWRNTISSLQNQPPSPSMAVTPNGWKVFFYPTSAGMVSTARILVVLTCPRNRGKKGEPEKDMN